MQSKKSNAATAPADDEIENDQLENGETENDDLEDDDGDEDEEIIRVARERFKIAEEQEADIRREALDDIKFSSGEQWEDSDVKTRKEDGRPSLVINRIPQFVRQISNDIRKNRPAVKVSPVDDQADVETAEVFSGIIRHIEYASNADTAYDTAVDSAVRGGFGYFRIVTEFADEMSFDQEIRIKRVPDRFSVRLDPSYREPDGADSNWGFVDEEIAREEFEAEYPDSKVATTDDFVSLMDKAPDWINKDTVRVAEYFYKELVETTICQLSTGDIVEEKDLSPELLMQGIQVTAKRKTHKPIVKWAKLNGVEVLEKTTIPSRWIPIIPVLGEELIIEGKRVLAGVVRHAKDSQRMYNYFASTEAEAIALAPKAPWVGLEGQFEGHEAEWAMANRRNIPFLQYKGKTLANGQPAPPPQRNSFEPAVQAISNGRALAENDLKATTGIYDDALGKGQNEQSGIAIQRRNTQSQTANFHFVDNLSKSIRHAGRILVDMIPKVYDTPRAMRILGEDGTEDVVTVNAVFEHNGKNALYDLSAGKYDVTVSSGPSYETKRQEAVASMMDLTRSAPQLMQLAGDIIVRNMDWEGADKIADRLKKALPPNIQDDPQGQAPLPPQVQAQLQQQGQMIDQLTQHLNQKTQQINTKSLELESKERIAMAEIQANVEIALARLGDSQASTLLKHQVAAIENRQTNALDFGSPIQDQSSQSAMNPPPNQGAGPQAGQSPHPSMGSPQANVQQPTGGPSPGKPMGTP